MLFLNSLENDTIEKKKEKEKVEKSPLVPITWHVSYSGRGKN
jgi:hypothetical protein